MASSSSSSKPKSSPLKLGIKDKPINVAEEDHYELKIIDLALSARAQNKILDDCKKLIAEAKGVIREQYLPVTRGVKLEELAFHPSRPLGDYIRPNFDGVMGSILFTLPFESTVEDVKSEFVPAHYQKYVFVEFWEATEDSDDDDQWVLNDPAFIEKWFEKERQSADMIWTWRRKYQGKKLKLIR